MSFAPIASDIRPGEFTPWGIPVPTFYRPHADVTVTVTSGGVSLGFTIAEVAIDRRWAIGPDGEIMAQTDFADTLPRVWDEQYRLSGASPQSHAGNPVPRVENYVAWTQDDARPDRLRPLARPRIVAQAPKDSTPLVDVSALRAAGYKLVEATETPAPAPAVVTASAPAAKTARKPMSAEARKAAGDRFRALHAARRAAKEAAPAAEE